MSSNLLNITTNYKTDEIKKSYSVVNETYNLIEAINNYKHNLNLELATCQYFKNEFWLFRASSNAPLREARFRSFKPILKNSFKPDDKITGTITIKPFIFDYDPDYRYCFSQFMNDYDLYNVHVNSQDLSDILVKIPSENKYTFDFSSDIKQTIKDINAAINQYFGSFDANGTFDFTNGLKHNYLRNYNQNEIGTGTYKDWTLPTDYSISDIEQLRNGYYLFALNKSGGTGTYYTISTGDYFDETKFYHSSVTIDNGFIGAVSLNKTCSYVVFIDHTYCYLIKDNQFTQIYHIEAADTLFTHIACNDRHTMIITNTTLEGDRFYILNGEILTPITPKNNEGEDIEINTYAIHGLNDKFVICHKESTDYILSVTNYLMNEWETIEDVTTNQISKLDVVNRIDAVYVCGFVYNTNSLIFWSKDILTDNGEWVREDISNVLSGTVTSLSHFGSNFLVSEQYSGNTNYVYAYPLTGSTTPTTIATFTNSGYYREIILSGSYGACSVLQYYGSDTTNKFYKMNLAPFNNDVLTLNDYKNLFNYPLDEISFIKLKTIDDPDDPDYSQDINKPTIYSYELMLPLDEVLLCFNISVETNPMALLFSSNYKELFNNIKVIQKSYLNKRNIFMRYSDTYDEDIYRINVINNDYPLMLCSQSINNVSRVIYSGFTEAKVEFKRIDVLPSTNYITIYIKDEEGNIADIDKLKQLFAQIIVEVDYIYEQV